MNYPQRKTSLSNSPLLLPLLFFFLFASACIVPPKKSTLNVLDKAELETISLVSEGRDLALGGRLLLAEEKFRRALLLYPELSALHQDLGYVLQGQNRLREAQESYQRAVYSQPKNLIARESLAEVLYLQGKYRSAILQYRHLQQEYQKQHAQWSVQAGLPPTGAQASPQLPKLRKVHRNIGIIYFALGITDEAICHSRKTLAYAAGFSDAGKHMRLLMSLNKTREAYAQIAQLLAHPDLKGRERSKYLLDYGILSYLRGEYVAAREAATVVAIEKQSDRKDKELARLLDLLSNHKLGDIGTSEIATYFAENTQICAGSLFNTKSHLPYLFAAEGDEFIKESCKYEQQSSS